MTINQAAGVPWLLANGPVALGSRSGTLGGPSGNPRWVVPLVIHEKWRFKAGKLAFHG
jgi:hypothetical protein